MQLDSDRLQHLYATRFGQETERRDDLWEVLCRYFFQKWVPEDSTVLDLAAGHCEFIYHIRAAERIAVDLNPEVRDRAAAGVRALVCASDDMTAVDDGSIDRVFVSNFFEHIPREVILSTLHEIRRVLRPSGQLLVLQPNVRFCSKNYWQFFDHITPVDDRALAEAMDASGLRVVHNVPRFLPYSTKGRLPSGPSLVRLYLRVPLAWRVLGAQTFMVASPA